MSSILTLQHQDFSDIKLSAATREFYSSIRVILCRDKDDEVVEYALSRNLSPTLIAQYLLQLPDKKLIQAKLHELLVHETWLDAEADKESKV